MSNSPTTFRGGGSSDGGIEWDDSAELHKQGDDGLGSRFKTIRRGDFAELIRFVMTFPENEQAEFSILKAGDRRFEIGEIRDLSRRPDFPAA